MNAGDAGPQEDGPDLSAEIVEHMRRWMQTGDVPREEAFGMDGSFRWMHESMRASSGARSENWYEQRHRFIQEFGFAIPCAEALDACARHQPLVEVGAGSGYWSALLRLRGVDVIATDPALAYRTTLRHGAHGGLLALEGKRAIRRFADRNVLMVWPSLRETWARQALKAMRVGRVLLEVTEGEGGCCAEDGFFAVLEDCFEEIGAVALPVFDGIHDRFTIWRKKRPYRSDRPRTAALLAERTAADGDG